MDNKTIELHTIATFQGKEYELENLLNGLLNKLEEKDKEIERLKNGYCELKVKCNNGECDCTNEEYDGMVESNIKLSLENDELRNILEKMGTNPNEILYLKNEVDELNNIINELEKYLYNEYLEWKDSENQSLVDKAFEDKEIYDYLKELKESK